jgi:hypothetical protein
LAIELGEGVVVHSPSSGSLLSSSSAQGDPALLEAAPSLGSRIRTVIGRSLALFGTALTNPDAHLAGLTALALYSSPGTLLTGMVAYACLLHARIPLASLQELADRCLDANAGSVRLMLGVLLSCGLNLTPWLAKRGSLAFLRTPAHALLSLIPMLIGCMLCRLAMEERQAQLSIAS